MIQGQRKKKQGAGDPRNLKTPPKVQKLQTALHAKAKGEPEFRFYALYDKIYRADVLGFAYACCRANKGAAGVDGQTLEQVEAYGRDRWLEELAQDLKDSSYKVQAVKRVFIPKPQVGQRPLGIPCLRDRVAQTAAMLVLEPIFEADMPQEQYAYRRGKKATEAVEQVRRLLNQGRREVVDADLSAYFETIPHSELLKSVARRIVDKRVLRLLKMWMEAPIEAHGERGGKQRTTKYRDTRRGITQGAPISPLLANLYFRRLVMWWKKSGSERRLSAEIVNYSDDLVICCPKGRSAAALEALKHVAGRMKLTINEEKTRIASLPESQFDFLGYSFGRRYSRMTGRPYLGRWPSSKSSRRIRWKIHEATARNRLCLDAESMVTQLNRLLRGWAAYFKLGPVTAIYRSDDLHARNRLRRWLCQKHKIDCGRYTCFPDKALYDKLGLFSLSAYQHSLPWAKG